MSSPPGKSDLKAGHAPAVKAGGMRVTQHKEKEKDKPVKPEEGEEQAVAEGPSKSEKHQQQLLLQGVVTKGDKDFPAEAVKAYHDKPAPAVERKHQPQHHHIQQPRK